ncbi:MerR family transcriptional regulator, repressor of the yfmOP operon [Thermostichus sp. MS-CIW-40]
MSYSEERLARIERTVEANAQAIAQLAQQNQELMQTIAGTEERIARAEERLEAEVKRWDERFFQLSRDTLNFTRNVVTIAAITAVLIPLLRDVAPLLIELLREGSR